MNRMRSLLMTIALKEKLQTLATVFFLLTSLLGSHAAIAQSYSDWSALLVRGIDARQSGDLHESIDALTMARSTATNSTDRSIALAALGATFLHAYRFHEAELALRDAYASTSGLVRARIAIDLGNLALAQKEPDKALHFYNEALALGRNEPSIYLLASLNLSRVTASDARAALLKELFPQIKAVPDASLRARLLLNLAQQSLRLDKSGLALGYDANMKALQDAQSVGSHRMIIEAFDGLAQIYEDHNRTEDSLALNKKALKYANAAPIGLVQDILVKLEWRQSRLLKSAGYLDDALAAMQRAATHLEALRQDLPIELESGMTSFASLLRPIYVGLADLILLRQAGGDSSHREAAANEAIGILELSRQAELQDYLGERCSVVSAVGGDQTFPAGTAVLYPLVLEDRIELLLKWGTRASYQTVKSNASILKRLSADLADGLRGYDNDEFLSPAQQIYNLLVRPLESDLENSQIKTLIVASEGFLRPIPFAALHDGKRFLIEKLALGTVTGMTMTDQTPPDGMPVSALVVGLVEPGTVVDKVEPAKFMGVAQVAKGNILGTRSLSDARGMLRDALRLPGVEKEMTSLKGILKGTQLVNTNFTVSGFSKEVSTGNYRILHIASHGIFGGDASSSFILASDDVLSINGLQSILLSDNLKRSPIDLLTLSACETAEGNDRAPLGFSGAAIKARARSVLGTLWPVVDEAAKQVMAKFYREYVGSRQGKATALRTAQIELLRQPDTNHPFFWAPFTLVGNWQ